MAAQVGDWGRLGEYNQSLVAESMAYQAQRIHPDFVLGVGDNFYPSRLPPTFFSYGQSHVVFTQLARASLFIGVITFQL